MSCAGWTAQHCSVYARRFRWSSDFLLNFCSALLRLVLLNGLSVVCRYSRQFYESQAKIVPGLISADVSASSPSSESEKIATIYEAALSNSISSYRIQFSKKRETEPGVPGTTQRLIFKVVGRRRPPVTLGWKETWPSEYSPRHYSVPSILEVRPC